MHDQRTCSGCGAAIVGRRGNAVFCSRQCKDRTKSADMLLRIRAAEPECSYPGCGRIRRTATAEGLCSMHYRRKRLGRDMDAPARAIRGGVADCTVEGCERKYLAGGLCSMHYERRRKTGEVGVPGIKRRHGVYRWTDPKSGYVYVEPGHTGRAKRMLEHRFVMEEAIGRTLLPRETVHHVSGVRNDNRIENLELWVKAHPAGQRVEDLIAFVVEHYATAVLAAVAERDFVLEAVA